MFLIIALGWLYVALMIALGSGSIVGGIFAFTGWGLIPVGILWYLFGRKRPAKGDSAQPPA